MSKAQGLNISENIITTDKISDKDLKYLLFNSAAYINLSTYEGFHFGPVQAMAAGIPAIASDTSCTPEVTKGGAFLINLKNLDGAIRSIKNFLEDDNLKKSYIEKGRLVAKEYNWDKTATQTWSELKNLIF